MKDSIIFIPFAWKENMQTGVNLKKANNKLVIYMKNLCVSLVSAKWSNPDSDVALVTNIMPPAEYSSVLERNNIKIIIVPFDKFVFDEKYTWGLAFYKLCAMYHVVREHEYKYYCYLDSDVYVQNSFKNIWEECNENIMLYDINHGLQVKDYQKFVSELKKFNVNSYITHFGGEFFAANRENALEFSEKCEQIYKRMIDEQYVTSIGDEFILSVVAHKKANVKNVGAYIYRFWTGRFRLISTNYKYNQVAVLHVPAEKMTGMITMFDRYVKKNKIPTKKKIHRILHLTSPRLIDWIKAIVFEIMNKEEQ